MTSPILTVRVTKVCCAHARGCVNQSSSSTNILHIPSSSKMICLGICMMIPLHTHTTRIHPDAVFPRAWVMHEKRLTLRMCYTRPRPNKEELSDSAKVPTQQPLSRRRPFNFSVPVQSAPLSEPPGRGKERGLESAPVDPGTAG